MTAELVANSFYINCMPAVPADPVIGGFDALYDNTAGSAVATATITTAEIELTDAVTGASMLWTLSMTPGDSGSIAAGTSQQVNHAKTGGAGTGYVCDYCNGTWDLNVSWDIGGAPVSDTLNMGAVYCVF